MVGLLILGFTAAVDAMFLGGLEFTPRDEALMEKLPFVIQGRWFFLSADGLLGKLESKLEGFTNRNGGFTISRSCQVPGPTQAQAVCLAMVSTVSTAKTPGQVPRSFLGILAALDQWIKAKKSIKGGSYQQKWGWNSDGGPNNIHCNSRCFSQAWTLPSLPWLLTEWIKLLLFGVLYKNKAPQQIKIYHHILDLLKDPPSPKKKNVYGLRFRVVGFPSENETKNQQIQVISRSFVGYLQYPLSLDQPKQHVMLALSPITSPWLTNHSPNYPHDYPTTACFCLKSPGFT